MNDEFNITFLFLVLMGISIIVIAKSSYREHNEMKKIKEIEKNVFQKLKILIENEDYINSNKTYYLIKHIRLNARQKQELIEDLLIALNEEQDERKINSIIELIEHIKNAQT